ncbi:MAG: hypothetical protein ACJ73D_08610 [Pyrinomonadaceae bacterium]
MNDKDRVRYEACKRSAQFGIDNPAPAGTIIQTKFTDLGSKVGEIETMMGNETEAEAKADERFQLKDVSREDLIEQMSRVANAARAAEPDNPGVQARFRFRRAMNDADLLAACNSFLTATAAEQTMLISYGAAANWHADMTDIHDAFSDAFSIAAGAHESEVSAGAELRNAISEAMQMKRTIGFMVPNYYFSKGAIAAWHSAAHVETPQPKQPPTPPTP